MHSLLQGYAGRNACVYIALDALLGRHWDDEGRDFVAGIIQEYNGYPSMYNHVLEEAAPIVVWDGAYNVQYEQPEDYVRIYKDGWRYRIHKNESVILSYVHDTPGYDVGHATCVPIRALFELRFKELLCIITAKHSLVIRDKG